MSDAAEVLANLELANSTSKLLAIVANVRGAEDAAQHEQIQYLGFPLSVSETFQQRNTNKSIAEAMQQLAHIQDICHQHGKNPRDLYIHGLRQPLQRPLGRRNGEIGFVEELASVTGTNHIAVRHGWHIEPGKYFVLVRASYSGF